jgi:energy-coupling factor transport system permease protein
MELRRFGKHKQRTWLKAKPIQGKDLLAIAVVCLIVALGLSLMVLNGGRFYNPFR